MATVAGPPLRASRRARLARVTTTGPSATGQWQDFSFGWNSGAATSATLSLLQQSTGFGGNDYEAAALGIQRTLIEVDLPAEVRDEVARRGIQFGVVNPWNWHHGSFEGIWMDPGTGEMTACGDPRRTAQALSA